MKLKFTLLCCLIFQCIVLKSQVPTEQDCLGAITICEPIYTTTAAPLGQGNYPNEVGPGTCQIQGEINSMWFKFSVISSGDLAFTIYPTSNMDYDWALYNLTNDNCASVLTNGSLLSSCNSSQYAITGISSAGVGNWNDFGFTNAFNYLLPVLSGELYYLQINNYYGVSGGFTIDFTASTATLFNCDSVLFGSTQTSICEKFCTSFIDSSNNDPTSWLWIFPGGSPSTSSDQNPVNICYNSPGTFDVTLITTNTTGSDTLLLPGYITVYPTPLLPSITQSGYTLTSTSAATYQWQFNSIDIPGATDQTYEVVQSGFYTVFITDENGCSSSSTPINVLITGIEGGSASAGVLIYPNPTNGIFMVEWLNGQMVGDLHVEVRNTLGQIVFSSEEKISSPKWHKQIDLKNMLPGVYVIEFSTGEFSKKNERVLLGKNKLIIVK